MATVMSPRTALPTSSKIKRPSLQASSSNTSVNKLSQPLPSPSTGSKRPPTDIPKTANPLKRPPSSSPAIPNGTLPRPATRRNTGKVGENGKTGKGARGSDIGIHKGHKLPAEPFVRDTSYILRKFKGQTPSLILHLHASHFRFDQQDGSFSYNSPMRVILEHIANQTIPHEMLDELHAAKTTFYDNCLIVQVQDHRNALSQGKRNISTGGTESQAFSVHNYNQHITPSSYVPYPVSAGAASSNPANADQAEVDGTVSTEVDKTNKTTHTYTTVLFPTPLTLQEDVIRSAALTIDSGKKNKNAATPMTPTSGAPSNKKRKLFHTATTLLEFESTVIRATAPPLFLDPVDSIGEVGALLGFLADPLCNAKLPPPKAPKKTVAEVAADEAQAAEEQRFMLIMDERLVAPTTEDGQQTAVQTAEHESGTAAFAPRFERFKLLEEIRVAKIKQREEEEAKRKREAEEARTAALQPPESSAGPNEAEDEAAKKAKELQKMQQARQLQAKSLENTRLRGLQMQQEKEQRQREAAAMAQMQLQQRQQAAVAQQMAQAGLHPSQVASLNAANVAIANQQHHFRSSPVVRNMTPQNASSPLANDGTHRPQAVPMSVNLSGQGAGSPGRPGSAMMHMGGVPMSMQRSQTAQSRHGTPMGQTPRMTHALPNGQNVMQTPQMQHSSPVMNGAMQHGAVMTPGHQLTPQQIMQRQYLAQQMAMQQHAQNGNVMVNGQQLTPEQMMRLVQQQQLQQRQNAAAGQAGIHHDPEAYKRELQSILIKQGNMMTPEQKVQLQAHLQARAANQQQRAQGNGAEQQNPMNPNPQLQHNQKLFLNEIKGIANQLKNQFASTGKPMTPDIEAAILRKAQAVAQNNIKLRVEAHRAAGMQRQAAMQAAKMQQAHQQGQGSPQAMNMMNMQALPESMMANGGMNGMNGNGNANAMMAANAMQMNQQQQQQQQQQMSPQAAALQRQRYNQQLAMQQMNKMNGMNGMNGGMHGMGNMG